MENCARAFLPSIGKALTKSCVQQVDGLEGRRGSIGVVIENRPQSLSNVGGTLCSIRDLRIFPVSWSCQREQPYSPSSPLA